MIVNRTQFADIIGCSIAQVGKLMKEGLPCKTSGKRGASVEIDTETAIKWYIEREMLRRGVDSNQDQNVADIGKARKSLVLEQERKYRIENDLLEGKLLKINEVDYVFTETIVMLGSLLDGAASKMASGDAVLREKLLNEHRRIRSAIADRLQTCFISK